MSVDGVFSPNEPQLCLCFVPGVSGVVVVVLVMRHWSVCFAGACQYSHTLLHVSVGDRVTAFCQAEDD